MKELAEAVQAVMKEVKGMEKNSRVGSGNYGYNGTKDQDVKEVFNEALVKNGLCILPTGIEESTELNRWQDNGKTKQSVFTKVTTKYLLLHTSGQSVELAGYGHGVDTQDKGAGKATTYALKNCLLYTFLTPVGKIDDSETTHSEEIETPIQKPEPKELPILVINSNNWHKAVDKKMSLEELAKHVTIPNDTAIKYKEAIK